MHALDTAVTASASGPATVPLCTRCGERYAKVGQATCYLCDRAAYGAERRATVDRPVAATSRPATEKQIAYARSLAAQRQIPATWQARVDAVLADPSLMDARKFSGMIDHLKALPWKAFDAEDPTTYPRTLPDVPAGRYAVATEAGPLAFYRVSRPTEGRWAGRTFVNVQASDDEHPVRGVAAATVLAKIAVDPDAAMARYGQEIGACGRCGKTLTDETSRALGIGPTCRSKS